MNKIQRLGAVYANRVPSKGLRIAMPIFAGVMLVGLMVPESPPKTESAAQQANSSAESKQVTPPSAKPTKSPAEQAAERAAKLKANAAAEKREAAEAKAEAAADRRAAAAKAKQAKLDALSGAEGGIVDGWKLNKVDFESDYFGYLNADAKITYVGDDNDDQTAAFTLVLRRNGVDFASLTGFANNVSPGGSRTVHFISSDKNVGAKKFNYEFQVDYSL